MRLPARFADAVGDRVDEERTAIASPHQERVVESAGSLELVRESLGVEPQLGDAMNVAQAFGDFEIGVMVQPPLLDPATGARGSFG